MPRLEEWSLFRDDSNPFLAPELRSVRLQGKVYGHEMFDDGDGVSTSTVQKLDLKNNIAETKNTVYELGEPSEGYIKWLNENGKELEDYILI